ncbi:ead/Ea22-like family protein [Klebsiella variicola]|uniref:ead/Ea22-like family protein n=1 Tax=Klebsiella variicola TaxID=244366 RepID=UPI001D18B6F3|nr:ead/Ea22-like family protein [Klebsiella variicola]
MTDITELAQSLKAAAELITSGYSRKWIVSHDDETCWVGANDDDGNLTPFIEVSIADWSGNKADNEALARFIALCRPAVVLALVEALDKSEKTSEARREAIDRTHNMFVRERDRANAAEEALEKARQRIEELESDLSEWTDCKHDGATYYDMSGQERCGRCGADV